MKYRTIAIEGNIGSGKTTLAKLLAQKLGATIELETFENNPFLAKFYQQPERYALPVELFFLTDRYAQLQKTSLSENGKGICISDYTLVKSLVFARVTLKDDELMVYERVFKITYPSIPQPDLIIFLQNTPDNLLHRIQERGRPYEKAIEADYLEKIDQSYEQYYRQSAPGKVLVLDVSKKDFLNNPGDVQQVIELLNEEHAVGVSEIRL